MSIGVFTFMYTGIRFRDNGGAKLFECGVKSSTRPLTLQTNVQIDSTDKDLFDPEQSLGRRSHSEHLNYTNPSEPQG